MIIAQQKCSNVKRYDITFTSYGEMRKEIATLVEFIKYHKFSIFIDNYGDSDCIATDFCDTIVIDRFKGRPIAKVLSDNHIPYRYF